MAVTSLSSFPWSPLVTCITLNYRETCKVRIALTKIRIIRDRFTAGTCCGNVLLDKRYRWLRSLEIIRIKRCEDRPRSLNRSVNIKDRFSDGPGVNKYKDVRRTKEGEKQGDRKERNLERIRFDSSHRFFRYSAFYRRENDRVTIIWKKGTRRYERNAICERVVTLEFDEVRKTTGLGLEKNFK